MTFKHPSILHSSNAQTSSSAKSEQCVCLGGEIVCNWENNQSRGMNTTICMEIGKLQIGPLTGIRENACFPWLCFFPRISHTSVTMAFTSFSWRWRERCFKVVNVREGLSCIVISPLFKPSQNEGLFPTVNLILFLLCIMMIVWKVESGKKMKKKWNFFFNSKQV